MLAELWQTSISERVANRPTQVARSPKVARLHDLCVLSFEGQDVLAFLQGYLTIDLSRLEADGDRLAALTNIKGRVVANGWCHLREPTTLDWIIHRSLAEPVMSFLKPYLAFSRSEAAIRTDDYLIVGRLPGNDGTPTVTIIDTPESLEQLLCDHEPVEESIWQLACNRAGIVIVSAITTEQYLPQMLGLVAAGAVDFSKGCYLGQEVVARAQHRGQVKRRLIQLSCSDTAASIASGDRLTDRSGRELGTVVAPPATDPDTGGQLCLAVLSEPLPDIILKGSVELRGTEAQASFNPGA